MVDVPFGVIGVLFRRGLPASSAGTVAFSFIHTNDMPVFLPPSGVFPVSSLPPNALRGAQNLTDR
jgi:hypothetical protein